MATLSKSCIEGIAQKMTEKSKKHTEALEKEYKQLATDIYESTVPAEVMKLFKSHSEYLETTQSLYLDGHGFNRESVSMTKQLPAKASYHEKLHLTAVTGDKLFKAKAKWEKAQKEYKQLFEETEGALYALKTYKNVKENLPEAIPFLPPPMSNSLVVNFDSLKKKLSRQPEVKSLTVS